MPTPTITVTGTKGKTTTVAVIADTLMSLGKNVLKVDTTGHFVNGERRSTLDDSKSTWALVPTVAPGRYLYEFLINPDLQKNGVAVLEAALGSSSIRGLAYKRHKVGIFLNVYEDHIGSSSRIQSKDDIVIAKKFIFEEIANGGYAVFNAEDPFVVGALSKIPEYTKEMRPVRLIPCGLDFEHFDITAHLKFDGLAVTVNGKSQVVLRQESGDTVLADLKSIPWTFDGTFMPSVWNIMSSAAAIIGYNDGVVPDGLRKALEAVRLDRYGGRLTPLVAKNGVKIIADYAHEKVSLGLVAELARKQVKGGGRVIGVVRLAHDRTDQLMRETAHEIAPLYDQFIVYDKIDGHFRKAKASTTQFPQVVGRTSKVFAGAIAEVNPNVERILREDEAYAHAAEMAKPGDVVVAIVNDDIEQSIGFMLEKFDADFA